MIEAHLAAIARINPRGHAFCTVARRKDLAWARERNAAVKKRAKLGPCTACPSRIKDLTITGHTQPPRLDALIATTVPTMRTLEVVRRL